MRNALVVLVPLCIGLTSGFIIPSSLREIYIDDLSEINNERDGVIRTRDTKPQIETNESQDTDARILRSAKNLCNENNEINNLEKDVYENTFKKDANINERSFILIKQRTRQPLRKHFMVNMLSKRNNDNQTSYSLRNNGFEEFRRRFSVGVPNRDRNFKGDTNLRSSKAEQYNIKMKNDFNMNQIYDSDFQQKNGRSNSKGQRKYLVSYIKPFLTPYIKIAPKANKVTLKPDHFRDMFVQQRILQRVSNKNPYKLVYPGGKTIDAIVNPNEGMYLINKNKKLSNGNSNDGDDTLERFIKNNSADQTFDTENNTRLDHFGLHYCPDCGEKSIKQNLSNRFFFEKKCKCKRKTPK